MSLPQKLQFKKKGKVLSLKKPLRVSREDKDDIMKKGQITGYFGLVHIGIPKTLQESNKWK